MLFLLILAFGLSMNTPPSLLKNTSALSQTYQQKCLRMMPENPQTRASLQSLLCGEKITDTELKDDLIKTSLIHIFIVSGSHLILLDQTLSIFRIPVILRFLSLGFYSLIVGWQAPAVRALLAILTRSGLRSRRFYFPGDLIVLLCGFLALILFPLWWTSMSFQMSWCAALALTTPAVFRISTRQWQGVLLSQMLIFVFMAPLLWGWGSLHPLGILCNLLLAPLVALVLLPLGFLSLFSVYILKTFEYVMSVFNLLLQAVAEPVAVPHMSAVSTIALWCWIFFLHIALHVLRLYLHQGKDRA
jgi:competence protein ComEC